jgi:alkylation response protein AidB-like acyl-CoA dehydrogenase
MAGVRVPADAMLGGADGAGAGFSIAMNGLNGGRINIAACSLGGAQAAHHKAARYVADREAFGTALIDEPTIRFTLADMATALETSRTLLWRAATALDQNHPNKVELCAMAKRHVTDACFDVADQALQLHGGYGYLNEYGLEKIVRDLRVHRIPREPTKSCAWSSVGPWRAEPAIQLPRVRPAKRRTPPAHPRKGRA